jgi:hypothetical protein
VKQIRRRMWKAQAGRLTNTINKHYIFDVLRVKQNYFCSL